MGQVSNVRLISSAMIHLIRPDHLVRSRYLNIYAFQISVTRYRLLF